MISPNLSRLTVACVLALPLGCVSEPPRRPSALDPSDPCNGESAAAPVARSTALAPAPTGAPATGSAVVYSCPMHPEVQQPGPGRCPKCGMTLAPNQREAGAAPTHHGMDHGMDGGM